MNITLFYHFFTFLTDGRGMSRPLGIHCKCKANGGNLSPRRQTNMRKLLLSCRNLRTKLLRETASQVLMKGLLGERVYNLTKMRRWSQFLEDILIIFFSVV